MIVEERYDLGKLVTFIPNKKIPIHNWFYFKEGFSRDFVSMILNKFKIDRGKWVLDPFCGVGTTLLTCKEYGVNSIGIDVSPLMVFVSNVKVKEYDLKKLKEDAQELFSHRIKKTDIENSEVSFFTRRFFPPRVLKEILFFREKIQEVVSEENRGFFTLGLMDSAIKCSYIYKDGGLLKIVERPLPPLRKFYRRRIKRMLRDLENIELQECFAEAITGDARRMEKIEDESFDLIVTSPPYLNKIEYTKVYRVEYELFMPNVRFGQIRSYLGIDIKKMEEGDKYGNLPPVARAYFIDMEKAIGEMYRVLKPGGQLVLVVAGGVFPTGVVESDYITARIIGEYEFEVDRIVVVNRRVATRDRVIKIGEARESIIIATKKG